MNPDSTGSRARWRPQGMDLRLAVAIGAAFLALLLLVWVSGMNTARLIDDAHWVDHTKDVIGELDATFSEVKDAESAQRGYLLTGKDAYLAPYRSSSSDLPGRLEHIALLTVDNPIQISRAARLRGLVQGRLSEIRRTIDLAREGHLEDARAFVEVGTGGKTMDAIQQLVSEMKADERSLLSVRAQRSRESARVLVTTLAIGGVLLFGFLVLIFYLIRADLTRRNQSEATIREREARIRRLIDANLIGVLFSDDGEVTDANDAFLSVVGIERNGWNPREHRVFGFTAPEFTALDETCEKEIRETGSCRPYQKELVRKDGTRVPVLFGSTSVDTGTGAKTRASFVVDLSELRRMEAERNRLYEDARDAVKARDSFLSVAGHEIRTPLSALNLIVYQLSRQVRSMGNEKASDLALRCEKQVARLIRLADELLDVSRLTAGTLHLDPEEMNLADLARDAVERMEETARRAGCALTLRAAGNPTGFWDRMRIDQVLSNLLTNALKFGPGEPVEVDVDSRGDVASLSVTDHGIGIDDADQRRVFERFERAVSGETYPGMGLGLWITREIVVAHGGKIGVESRPGAGARFLVTLPRRMESDG